MAMIVWPEVRTVARRVLRWWWMVVLAVAFAVGSAFYMSQGETRFYVAHTSLLIGNTLESRLPDQNQLAIGSSLARYYGEMARREPILKPVQETLQLPFSWQILSDRMLMTNVVPTANLLEIYITDSNPDRAAAIANAIGERLIAFSPTAPEKIQAEKQAVEQQLKESQKKIKDLQDKIDELTAQQQSATSASDLAEINQKLALTESSLAEEKTSYKSLLNYQSSSDVNSLQFFEKAAPPNQPLPSKRSVILGFAGLAGLMLALTAVFVLEKLDDRLRGPDDVGDRFDMDDLGTIPLGPPLLTAPDSFAEERMRAARDAQTNIMLAAAEQGARILMITSPESSESRSAFTIDLADLFGRSGHRVLIVDADFTSSLLTRMLAQPGAVQAWTVMAGDHSDLWSHLRPTPMENVALLPGRGQTGGAPPMIPSLRWRELVERLLGTADVIIFDGPSALHGPDAALLAPHVDGVVLALDPAIDNREDIAKSKSRLLHQKGARLLGAVTFAPPRQRPRLGGVVRQGRGQPALPEPRAASPQAGGWALPEQRGPLVTPAPDARSMQETAPDPAAAAALPPLVAPTLETDEPRQPIITPPADLIEVEVGALEAPDRPPASAAAQTGKRSSSRRQKAAPQEGEQPRKSRRAAKKPATAGEG